jgi:hypothetical protein
MMGTIPLPCSKDKPSPRERETFTASGSRSAHLLWFQKSRRCVVTSFSLAHAAVASNALTFRMAEFDPFGPWGIAPAANCEITPFRNRRQCVEPPN